MAFPPEISALVSQITALIPDASISSGILDRLKREYEAPPCSSLELLLRRGVSLTSARALLFHPTPDENGVGVYGALIGSPPPGSGENHPLRRVQTPFLSLLYLVHLRSWSSCAAFVRGGGLAALSRLLLDPNVYLRGQALECFLQVTSHPDYDWFAPPSTARDDRDLHDAVLALAHPIGVEDGEGSSKGAASVPFLSALLQNWDTPAPGVSFGALQLVAWWLSWVRALHTKGGELRLSGPIIAALQAWALRPEAPVEGEEGPGPSATKAFSGKEEATLARKLFEDFSRFPILGGGGGEGGGGGGGGGASGDKDDDGQVQGLKYDAAWARSGNASKNTGSLEQLREEGHATGEGVGGGESSKGSGGVSPEQTAALCKEQGNAHFRGERWAEASRVYGQGIAAALGGVGKGSGSGGGGGGGGSGDPELLTALLSNRALSRLRAAGYGSSLYPAPSMLALLSLVSPAAQSALRALLLSSSLPEAPSGGGGVGEEAEEEGDGGKGGAFKHLLAQVTPPQRAALVCLFGALSDCERALALNPRHKKVLLRKAQVLLSLGEGGVALECCKTAVAVPAAVQGEDSSLAAQCTGFLTYVMTYVASRGEVGGGAGGSQGRDNTVVGGKGEVKQEEKQEEEEEEEEELSILSALLCRAEYGGVEGGGKQNSTLLVNGPNRGSGGREEGDEGGEEVWGEGGEEEEGVGQLLKGWVGGGDSLTPRTSSKPAPTTSAPASVSVDDILSGRLKEKDKTSKGKKTFSLPSF